MIDEIVCFYSRFSRCIEQVKTVEQKIDVLDRMQEAFQAAVRDNPQIRNQLSLAYEELKIRCERVIL